MAQFQLRREKGRKKKKKGYVVDEQNTSPMLKLKPHRTPKIKQININHITDC